MIARVLVGIDGSDEAAAALAWAAELAEHLGAELVVSHAIGLVEVWHERVEEHEPDPVAAVRADAERWCSSLADRPGLRWRLEVEPGSPAPVVLRLVERDEVDVVVVGSRGIGGADPAVLGSTSHELASACPVPVVVVPHPE